MNTEIYRLVFACYPDDQITQLKEIKDFKLKRNLNTYEDLGEKIKGHIVQFPVNFLADEVLTFGITNKEYYLPHISFT